MDVPHSSLHTSAPQLTRTPSTKSSSTALPPMVIASLRERLAQSANNDDDASLVRSQSNPTPNLSARTLHVEALDELTTKLLIRPDHPIHTFLYGYLRIAPTEEIFPFVEKKITSGTLTSASKKRVLDFLLRWWTYPLYSVHQSKTEPLPCTRQLIAAFRADNTLTEEIASLQKILDSLTLTSPYAAPSSSTDKIQNVEMTLNLIKNGLLEKEQLNTTANTFAHDLNFLFTDLYLKIDPSEWLINLNKDISKTRAPNLHRYITHFEQSYQFFVDQLLHANDKNQFMLLFEFSIMLGQKCLEQGNFTGVNLLVAASNNTSVSRLFNMCSFSRQTKSAFNSLTDLCKPEKSWKPLRQAINSRLASGAPCIPFLLLMTKDMAALEENCGEERIWNTKTKQYELNVNRIQQFAAQMRQLDLCLDTLKRVPPSSPLTDLVSLITAADHSCTEKDWQNAADARSKQLLTLFSGSKTD